MMKKTVLAAAALVVAVFWSAPAPAEIKIGLMTPLTGAFASEGQDMLKVCEILTGEVNKAGGINGQKVIFLNSYSRFSGAMSSFVYSALTP